MKMRFGAHEMGESNNLTPPMVWKLIKQRIDSCEPVREYCTHGSESVDSTLSIKPETIKNPLD